MNGSSYHLIGIRRRLNDTFCLQIDDLAVRRGEVLSLLGPTGAGKTTLMRLLTGVEHPDEGDVQFHGEPLDQGTQLSLLQQIAMVHQRPILLDGSVENNIAYGLRVRRRPLCAKVNDVIARLGLRGLARRDARLLSGGQLQLVALARALVLEPEVLLLDEPTSNLDPAYVSLIESVISEIQASQGMTVIWATHNLFQARRVSQSVALLLEGKCIEVAEAAAFFMRPNDVRTADFIQGKITC